MEFHILLVKCGNYLRAEEKEREKKNPKLSESDSFFLICSKESTLYSPGQNLLCTAGQTFKKSGWQVSL